MSQQAPVAVVTGASRGAGRGIAKALGAHGCTVYVTGRSQRRGDAALPGTILETAEAVTRAGGKGIAVRLDHGNDEETKALFEQVKRDQGRLDILVNNAAAITDELTTPGNFWEKSLNMADLINVGIRSSYVASYYAAPLLVEQRKGLVVFTSGSGAAHYVYGPAYGAHKVSQDKMAADMAEDFKPFGVVSVSIWMGALLTDRLRMVMDADPAKAGHLEKIFETPEFTGHVIWAFYSDPDLKSFSGQTLIAAELARQYGLQDEDGRQPPSYRDRLGIAPRQQHPHVIR